MPRDRLPNRRASTTIKCVVGGQNVYLTYSRFADGRLGEVFCRVSKSGSAMAGMTDALAIAISLGLQSGVPLETFVNALRSTAFEPAGAVEGCAGVETCSSIVDLIVRVLAAEAKAAA